VKLRYLPVFVALSLLGACGGSPPPPADPAAPATTAATPAAPAAEDKVLNIYNWSDYVAEDTIASFEKETGIKVVYDVYDANEILEAKLMAGQSGYDVVFPSARPFAERHIKSGLYRPLDKSKLHNYGNLNPAILKSLEDVDPGNAHLIPYMWTTTGLGYNVKALKQRLGENAALDSWNLLFDPAIVAKLKDCGVSVLDDEQEGFGAALFALGRDPNGMGGGEIEAVTAIYAKVRPSLRYFNSSKYIDDLANGEVCLAMGYNGDVLQARDRAQEASNGIEIAYLNPKEGALRAIDSAAIPVDAPHPDNAHVFLDYLMRPEVIASITNYVAYANANSKATELVDESIRNDPGIYPSEETIAKLVDPRTLPDDEARARVRAWTSIKSGD
jgi:putrescine transport system substrate-binding protein